MEIKTNLFFNKHESNKNKSVKHFTNWNSSAILNIIIIKVKPIIIILLITFCYEANPVSTRRCFDVDTTLFRSQER